MWVISSGIEKSADDVQSRVLSLPSSIPTFSRSRHVSFSFNSSALPVSVTGHSGVTGRVPYICTVDDIIHSYHMDIIVQGICVDGIARSLLLKFQPSLTPHPPTHASNETIRIVFARSIQPTLNSRIPECSPSGTPSATGIIICTHRKPDDSI